MTKEELELMIAKAVAAAKTEEAAKPVEKNADVEAAVEVKEFDASTITKSIEDGFKSIADSLKVDKGIEIGAEPMEKDAKGGFKSMSHFAVAVAKATRSGFREVSKELDAWEKYVKAAGSPSQNESDPEAGGHLIPPEFRQDILVGVEQKNDILPRVTKVPMQSNTVSLPYVNGFDESGGLVYGGVEWKWLDEEKSRTATNVKFGKVTLQLKKLAGLAYASDELLEDSPMSMENILRNGFRDGLAFQYDKVFMRGSGVGQPLGILNAPCKVSVAKETGQAAQTINFFNIIKMYSRAANPSACVWMVNPDTLPQLCSMSLAVGTGGVPVYLPSNSVSGMPYNTLFGLPLIFNKHCSTVGTEGDICLVDWSQYLLGMKANANDGGTFATSAHLKFDIDQVAYKISVRLDGQLHWPSAFTGPQGTATYSPVVTLATRA